MIYTEKELRDIKKLDFNSDVDLPHMDKITVAQLDPNVTYVFRVEIETYDNIDVCCNLSEMLKDAGITKFLIIPTFYGQTAININELEQKLE